jgi:hypothetical protein
VYVRRQGGVERPDEEVKSELTHSIQERIREQGYEVRPPYASS